MRDMFVFWCIVLEMEREDFDASLVAAACVYVARKGTGIYPIWPKHL